MGRFGMNRTVVTLESGEDVHFSPDRSKKRLSTRNHLKDQVKKALHTLTYFARVDELTAQAIIKLAQSAFIRRYRMADENLSVATVTVGGNVSAIEVLPPPLKTETKRKRMRADHRKEKGKGQKGQKLESGG
jgi:hypothetical protein